MEKFVYYAALYDYYQNLLTAKNAAIFSYYYEDNFSLQEIADLLGVSKSYIGASLKNTEKKLQDLEAKLHLYHIEEELNKCLESDDIEDIKKRINTLLKED